MLADVLVLAFLGTVMAPPLN